MLLCGFAFLAGFIDSLVGGGGLIQLPALLVLLPHVAVATIFGTNKMSSIFGTGVAVRQYARYGAIAWKPILLAAGTAFIFSFIGARLVSLIHADVLRPVILVLLIAVAITTFLNKNLGALHAPKLTHNQQIVFGIGTGVVLGFYDGFFGPGTGSFLIFVFIGLFGLGFLEASASAKVVNFATNLSAVLYFAFTHHILYHIALPMAAFNIFGSIMGTRLAILKGSRFLRFFYLVVVTAIILKFAWDIFKIRELVHPFLVGLQRRNG